MFAASSVGVWTDTLVCVVNVSEVWKALLTVTFENPRWCMAHFLVEVTNFVYFRMYAVVRFMARESMHYGSNLLSRAWSSGFALATSLRRQIYVCTKNLHPLRTASAKHKNGSGGRFSLANC